MKKILFCTIVASMVVLSCEYTPPVKVGVNSVKATSTNEVPYNLYIGTHTLQDGCTYAVAAYEAGSSGGGASVQMMHSPACSNPKHK